MPCNAGCTGNYRLCPSYHVIDRDYNVRFLIQTQEAVVHHSSNKERSWKQCISNNIKVLKSVFLPISKHRTLQKPVQFQN